MPTTAQKYATNVATHARRSSIKALFALCFIVSLSALPSSAFAASKKSQSSDTTATTSGNTGTASKKKHSVRITHQRSPSEETTAERDRRLYRECRGMPNAGACLGYTGR